MNSKKFICEKSVSQSLDDCLRRVRCQLDVEGLIESGYTPEVESIVNLVADAYMRPPAGCIRIGNELKTAGVVIGMYKQLTRDHIEMVIDNFRAVKHSVKNKSVYIRTALYNAVLEYDLHCSNLFNQYEAAK